MHKVLSCYFVLDALHGSAKGGFDPFGFLEIEPPNDGKYGIGQGTTERVMALNALLIKKVAIAYCNYQRNVTFSLSSYSPEAMR